MGALPPCPRRRTKVDLLRICREVSLAEQTVHQVYREIHPHLHSLIARAGAFATPEEVDTLPPPRLPPQPLVGIGGQPQPLSPAPPEQQQQSQELQQQLLQQQQQPAAG